MHVEKQERRHCAFSFASEAKREGRRAKVFTLIALCTNELRLAGEEVKVKNENCLTRARARGNKGAKAIVGRCAAHSVS